MYSHDVHGSVLTKLPEYIRQNGLMSPSAASAGPFQFAFGTTLHHFDWLRDNPRQSYAFNSMMTAQRRERGQDWFEYFPVEERFAEATTYQQAMPIFVDIGGGFGADLAAFELRYPGIKSKLILEELPDVVESIIDLPVGIETLPYDFFTPQPVLGASFYYMRTILHDWPDREASMILQRIHTAMTPESTLLINEFIMPDSGAPQLPSKLDLSMMAMFSSMERTCRQWKNLLQSAGFVIVRIWSSPEQNVEHSSLIEARLNIES